jgi:hypothetical protein
VLPRDYPASFTRLGSAERSRGHLAGAYAIDVRGNAIAREAIESGAHVMPVGSVLVAAHTPDGPVFVMEKRPLEGDAGAEDARRFARGDASRDAGEADAPAADAPGAWRWIVIEPGGRVSADGALALCVSCHAQAPRDGVFTRPAAK